MQKRTKVLVVFLLLIMAFVVCINTVNAGIYNKYGYLVTKQEIYENLIDINNTIIDKIDSYEYTGEAIKPILSIRYDGNILTLGKDYIIEDVTNTEVGQGVIRVVGIGEYVGSRNVSFEIIQGQASRLFTVELSNKDEEYIYDGNPKLPEVIVKNGDTVLVKDKDYKLSYGVNIYAGNGYIYANGMGNYTGTKVFEFKIKGSNVENLKIAAKQEFTDGPTQGYLLLEDGTAIYEGVDYIGSAIDNSSFGTKTIEITGKGNYAGTRTITFELGKGNMEYCIFKIGEGPASVSYDTKSHEYKVPIYTRTNITLKEGRDYTVSYKNNVYAGLAEIIYTGIGKYEGTTAFKFYIDPVYIRKMEVDLTSVKYTGEEHKKEVKVYTYQGESDYEKILLTEGIDYTLTYSDNINAGTVYVTVKGINSCIGTLEEHFEIEPVDISELEIEGIETEYNYIKGGIRPKLVIKHNGKVLVENENYYASVIESKAAGTVSIIMYGNYSGVRDIPYKIKATNINNLTFEKISDVVYGNTLTENNIRIYHNGIRLEVGKDFYWSQVTSNKLGTNTISITGTGSETAGGYIGTAQLTYNIGYDINNATVTGVVDKVYTGSNITQGIIVKYGKTTLKNGVDYTITYKNNKELGVATLVITGKGSYIGTKEINFNIVKRSVTTFTYNKVADYAYTGFEIKPSITATYGGKTLVEGVDYTVSYENNIKVGTGKIIITGIGDYSGTKTIKFNIVARSIKSTEITGLEVKYYTAKSIKQNLTIMYKGIKLVEGVDYTLSYKNNTKPGTATITVTGKGNFRSSTKLEFKIKDRNINDLEITAGTSMAYTGGARNPSVKVVHNGTTLKNGTHYTVSYKNNVYPGTGTITIKGKGNYNGTKVLTYTINPRSINSVTIKGFADKAYTGGVRKQSLTLTYNKKTLKEGKDYILTYENNVEIGTATVKITGKGNFTGEKILTYKINRRSISSVTFNKIKSYAYTGKAITPSIKATYGSYTLIKDKDYTISYSKNTKPGTATITITGIGNFTGTKTIKFSIVRRSIVSAIVEGLANKEYTRKAIKQNLELTYNGITLKNGVDYKLTYKNNTNPGTAAVTITGLGNFTSSKKLTFKIVDRDINDLDITYGTSMAYTGGARNPSVKVVHNGTTLKNGTHYTVSYKNNVYPGTGTITIKGKGNYTGTKILTYTINPRSIASATITGLVNKTYTGSETKQSLKLVYNKKTLKLGTDYTVTYENNIEPGTATVKVTGIGNFQGEKVLTYNITKGNVSNLTYSVIYTQSYTGEEVKPNLVIKNGSNELVEGVDYSITYSNNINVGTALITITGIGNYTGKKEIKFSIKEDIYYIKINVQANTVTIYKGPDTANLKAIKAMVCSTGTATPKKGKYTIKSRWNWLKLVGNVYGQYCTQITGDILFHSVPYKEKSPDTLKYEEYDKLGTKASAGCIRLTVEDAKWIYDNIKKGVTVEFYNSSTPGPLGKPTAPKISDNIANRNWDPTDPNPNNPWHGEAEK